MRFTFASWNLNSRRVKSDNLLKEYLYCLHSPFPIGKSPCIDIIALQEVRRSTFERLNAGGRFAQQFHSLGGNGTSGEWGCGLFVSDRFKITSQCSFDFGIYKESCARFANQALVVEALCKDTRQPLRLGSFHIPNGTQHGIHKGDFKRKFGHCIAAWLNVARTTTVFGIDANSPQIDHIDASKVKLFRSDSEDLFGAKRTHDLRDVYLDQRRAHPEESAAISFKRNQKTPTRFDQIWATKDIKVRQVKYGQLTFGSKGTMLYATNGTEVLSDHAWVAAELSI